MIRATEHGRIKWIIGILCFVAAIVAAVKVKPRPKLTGLGGIQLEVISVTHATKGGTHNLLEGGSSIKRLDHQLLPRRWSSKLGIMQGMLSLDSADSLVLWIQSTSLPNAPTPRLDVVAIDPLGFEIAAHPTGMSMSQQGKSVESVSFASFPRTLEYLTFRVYQRDQRQQLARLGEFVVKNPARTTGGSWTAPEVSNFVTNQGLVVKLAKLEVVAPKAKDEVPVKDGRDTLVEFQFPDSKQSLQSWMLTELRIEGESGNHTAPSALETIHQDNQIVCRMQGTHPSDDTVWRVVGRFSRRDHASFATNELWSVGPLELTETGTTNEIPRTTRLAGSDLHFSGITPIEGRTNHFRAVVGIPYSETSRIDVSLLDVTDKAGGKCRLLSTNSEHSVKDGLVQIGFGFEATPETTAVALRFAVQEPRTVQFHAKPQFGK